MTTFQERYAKLNTAQKQAVETIDGPLMVVAGPGTGKTELLSMRTANILKKTDTLPDNILCLTFTESGANAMRERLTKIIGADAYKVAIHTFHSFGTEVINQYRKFFYSGADFRPADELSSYEILRTILDELPFNNPLTSKMNGEYTHLSEIITTISELKRSSLTSDELLKILDSNDETLDRFEPAITNIFDKRVTKDTVKELEPLSLEIAEHRGYALPSNFFLLANTIAISLAHAIDDAASTDSTKPITAWKNKWTEKNEHGKIVFKDRKRHEKLRALSYVYLQYLNRMQEAALYDFDDMVLRVVHAIEVFPELRYTLQEKYLYIMVDEFQDTNFAQARILTSLTALETGDAPNIMVVGDDDQAIYSFQGAEVRNIMHFREQFEGAELVVLTENYRSAEPILEQSRNVILQGTDRLENYVEELNKTLKPQKKYSQAKVSLGEYATPSSERGALIKNIQEKLTKGIRPEEIVVLTRRHKELEALLPYFNDAKIPINYERRDDILQIDVIRHLMLLAGIVTLIGEKRLDEADELIPKLLAHPAWKFNPDEIWKLSLAAYKNRSSWLEEMSTQPRFVLLHRWLIETAQRSLIEPAEVILDELIGKKDATEASVEKEFTSPLYEHYFAKDVRDNNFDQYLTYLEALRTIRTKLREYTPGRLLLLADFVEFIELHQQNNTTITSVRASSDEQLAAVKLMTAHKSKGLEFDHVFILGATDNMWGEKARSRSRLISYPENLPLSPNSNTLDERLRLFFVAMTRARRTLSISYASTSDTGKQVLPASFLVNDTWGIESSPTTKTSKQTVSNLEREWHAPYISIPQNNMKHLLKSTLERYKLSATHLNTFLDVTRGGPQNFLLQNLLRFPQAMSSNASYGSAIHRTLQRVHTHIQATGTKRPLEDILGEFETVLHEMHLSEKDHTHYLHRGTSALTAFLLAQYDNFTENDTAELSFSGQQSRLGSAHLTGALDVVRIDTETKTIVVTDYKTGSPSTSWQGKTDYEKQKLHRYRQQLMFYKLLIEHSRDFANYTVEKGVLQFVEPTKSGQVHSLDLVFDSDEVAQFTRLVLAVWQRIQNLDIVDTSKFTADHKGIVNFEAWLLDEHQ